MGKFLHTLSNMVGISDSYEDKMGVPHYTRNFLRRIFLRSLGYPLSYTGLKKSVRAGELEYWKNGFDYVYSFFDTEQMILPLCIPADMINQSVKIDFNSHSGRVYSIVSKVLKKNIIETKTIDNHTYVKVNLVISKKLPTDYYDVVANIKGFTFRTFVIFAPQLAYIPQQMRGKRQRSLALGIQLYAMRSKTDIGIGDFSALRYLIQMAPKNHYKFIGVNPLGAMCAYSQHDVSPYRSLSRQYLNYIYIDLSTVPEFKNSLAVQSFVATKKISGKIMKLRQSEIVDYYSVFELKLSILRLMYEYFIKKDIAQNTPRAVDFARFKMAEGAGLSNLCLLESMSEINPTDWQNWDTEYKNIHSFETTRFKLNNGVALDFYAYCHWLAHTQLMELKQLAKKYNVEFYLDIPVGAASNGAEVWQSPENFAPDIDIGAPPDNIRPRGQTWGLTPPNPIRQRQTRYHDFINLLNHTLRYAGAIRLDHSFFLQRLYWVANKRYGAYVNYSIKDMTAILCLESHKHKSIIIGEDLGNVPDGFREYMAAHHIFSNKILFRQKDKDGDFLYIDNYPYHSLAQVSTHDQATSCGFWISEDIHANNNCHLYPKAVFYRDNLRVRQHEREDFIKILSRSDCFFDNKESFEKYIRGNDVPKNLEYSFNMYGAKTKSAIFLVRAEDIFRQTKMENVPSTVDEYPNWRIKLPITVEDFPRDGRITKLFAVLSKIRK